MSNGTPPIQPAPVPPSIAGIPQPVFGSGSATVPATPIPGLDALVDIGAPLALLWYWWTFFRDLRSSRARPPPAARAGR